MLHIYTLCALCNTAQFLKCILYTSIVFQCTPHIDVEVLAALVPRLVEIIKSGIGLGTKVCCMYIYNTTVSVLTVSVFSVLLCTDFH